MCSSCCCHCCYCFCSFLLLLCFRKHFFFYFPLSLCANEQPWKQKHQKILKTLRWPLNWIRLVYDTFVQTLSPRSTHIRLHQLRIQMTKKKHQPSNFLPSTLANRKVWSNRARARLIMLLLLLSWLLLFLNWLVYCAWCSVYIIIFRLYRWWREIPSVRQK